MSAEATARATETPATAPANIEFYRTRDEMVRAYAPQTEEERLLVFQIARTWLRLQKFYELESHYLEQGLTDLFTNDIERYKTLCRTVAEAERAWRHAVAMFERARKRSGSVSFSSRGTSVPQKVTQTTPRTFSKPIDPFPRRILHTQPENPT